MLVLWCWPARTGTAPVSVFRVYPCVSEWLIEPPSCCRTARSEKKAPGAGLIHNLALLSKHVYCAVMWHLPFKQHLARWDCCRRRTWTLLRDWGWGGGGGLTSGSPSNLRRSYINSLHLQFLPFTFTPTSSPSSLRLSTPESSLLLPLPHLSLLLIISWCWEWDRGCN